MAVIEVSQEEFDAMLAGFKRRKQARAEKMPTEQDAINQMLEAWQRLKELGWREAIYCPKDGSEFDVIEPGSTGIHSCTYHGEWPTGTWWVSEAGDLWPSRPILFRVPAPSVDGEA